MLLCSRKEPWMANSRKRNFDIVESCEAHD